MIQETDNEASQSFYFDQIDKGQHKQRYSGIQPQFLSRDFSNLLESSISQTSFIHPPGSISNISEMKKKETSTISQLNAIIDEELMSERSPSYIYQIKNKKSKKTRLVGVGVENCDSEGSEDEFELMKAEIQKRDHSKMPYVNSKNDVIQDDKSDNSVSVISSKLRPEEDREMKDSGTFSFGKRNLNSRRQSQGSSRTPKSLKS